MEDETVTRCSICLETFKDPKALPCLHTFCLQCIDRHCETTQPNVSCPLCRKAFTIPSGGNINLPNNFFVVSQLSQAKRSTGGEATENGMPGPSKKTKWGVNYCEEHRDKQNRLYCFDCVMVTCPICIINKHRRHDLADVDKSTDLIRQQIHVVVDSLSSLGPRRLENIKQLDNAAEYLEEKFTNAENEILQKYDELIARMQSDRIELIEELNEFKSTVLEKVEAEKGKIARNFEIAQRLEEDVFKITKRRSVWKVCPMVRELKARAGELVRIQDERDRHKVRVGITFRPSDTAEETADNVLGALHFRDEISADSKKLDFTYFLKTSAPHNLLSIGDDRITGITVIGSKMYLVRNTAQVYGYRVHDFSLTRRLIIPDARSLKVISSCSHFNCLYAVDYAQDKIYRYDLTNDVITKWLVTPECTGLSVTKNFNVLASLFNTQRIHEYSTDGNLIRSILLEMDHPRHCIQLSTDNYVVSLVSCHRHRVCIADQSGHMIQSYDYGSRRSSIGQLDYPLSLAVDEHDNILIADYDNNRVHLLSPSLTHLGDIVIPRYQLNRPYVLYFDKLKCHLFIGEDSDYYNKGRLFALRVNVKAITENSTGIVTRDGSQ